MQVSYLFWGLYALVEYPYVLEGAVLNGHYCTSLTMITDRDVAKGFSPETKETKKNCHQMCLKTNEIQ